LNVTTARADKDEFLAQAKVSTTYVSNAEVQASMERYGFMAVVHYVGDGEAGDRNYVIGPNTDYCAPPSETYHFLFDAQGEHYDALCPPNHTAALKQNNNPPAATAKNEKVSGVG